MFKNIYNTSSYLNKFFLKTHISNKYYKPIKLNTTFLQKNVFVHTGNSLILRNFSYLFLGRQIKYNVLFKKPLVRPAKKKKK